MSAVQRSGDTGAQAPFLVNTNWSQFGFTSDGQRANPYENVLNPSTVGGLDLLWSYTTGGAVQASPSVVDGVVYVGSSDSNLYALKASTGAKLWSFPTGSSEYDSPAVANGVVYVGSSNGPKLVCAERQYRCCAVGVTPIMASPVLPHPR